MVAVVFASLMPLCAQDAKQAPAPQPASAQDSKQEQSAPPASGQKQEELKKVRPKPATSNQVAEPAEEDTEVATDDYSFNPLESKNEVQRGDFYEKTRKNYRAAANDYIRATKYNDGNSEAWLKLAEVEEKLHDMKAARDAFTKYLTLEPDSKRAPEIKKKLEKLK